MSGLVGVDGDVQQGDLVVAAGALAGGDQLLAAVAGGDGQDLDGLADDGRGTGEASCLVEGVEVVRIVGWLCGLRSATSATGSPTRGSCRLTGSVFPSVVVSQPSKSRR